MQRRLALHKCLVAPGLTFQRGATGDIRVGMDDVREDFGRRHRAETGWCTHVRKLAATAFKTLLARIRYPNNDPREILLDAPLVIRRST